MATNHTCSTFVSGGLIFNVLQTKASNIRLINLGTPKKIRDTSFYGMNASYFDTVTAPSGFNKILNIVYQDGVCIGFGIDSEDGEKNTVGKSVMTWDGSSLKYHDNVLFGSSSNVPKTSNSWAQGGVGLFLCDTQWENLYKGQLVGNQESDLGGISCRAGIMINTNTKNVYLINTTSPLATVAMLRKAMMNHAGLTEGGSAGYWRGMMVDGGLSVQLRGDGMNAYVVGAGRGIPQMIGLKDKS